MYHPKLDKNKTYCPTSDGVCTQSCREHALRHTATAGTRMAADSRSHILHRDAAVDRAYLPSQAFPNTTKVQYQVASFCLTPPPGTVLRLRTFQEHTYMDARRCFSMCHLFKSRYKNYATNQPTQLHSHLIFPANPVTAG